VARLHASRGADRCRRCASRDHESFLYAIADALHDEYQAIVEAGFDVQIDDAYIASEYDGMVPPGSLDDCRRWADAGVAALNHALRGILAARALPCLLGQPGRPA
jgi:5-methyltetrahydropteroyltriglutamate--homocysteine methyltransferase